MMKRVIFIISLAFIPFFCIAQNHIINDNKDLRGQVFHKMSLNKSSWRNAILIGANFNFAKLYGADFSDAIITKAELGGNRFTGGIRKEQLYSTKSYKDKNLEGVNFSVNSLTGWDFSEQNLENARFEFSVLSSTSFRNANLKNVSFFDKNSGASFFYKTDFSDAVITYCIFKFATSGGLTKYQIYSTKSYKDRNLEGINFVNCTLNGWDFSKQNLKNANFENAKLVCVDFSFANLDGVNFKNADLRGANFGFAKLNNVNFENANTTKAIFSNLKVEATRD